MKKAIVVFTVILMSLCVNSCFKNTHKEESHISTSGTYEYEFSLNLNSLFDLDSLQTIGLCTQLNSNNLMPLYYISSGLDSLEYRVYYMGDYIFSEGWITFAYGDPDSESVELSEGIEEPIGLWKEFNPLDGTVIVREYEFKGMDYSLLPPTPEGFGILPKEYFIFKGKLSVEVLTKREYLKAYRKNKGEYELDSDKGYSWSLPNEVNDNYLYVVLNKTDNKNSLVGFVKSYCYSIAGDLNEGYKNIPVFFDAGLDCCFVMVKSKADNRLTYLKISYDSAKGV